MIKRASTMSLCSKVLLSVAHWMFRTVLILGMGSCYSNVVTLEYFGLHIHRADNGTAWPKSSFGSWRLWDAYVQWTHLQPTKETWNFTKLDLDVAMAKINKVSILLPLGLSPQWASSRPNEESGYGRGNAAEPTSIEDWRSYVRTVGIRYKNRINAYEIWNEPNDKVFFSGTTSKLVELTCVAYLTLKAIDASIIVVSPAYTGEENIGKLEEFLAMGGGKCIDVVSYHLYVTPSPPEAIPSLVERIRQAMKRQGLEHLPLWNTETGWEIKNTDGTPEGKPSDYWLRVGSEQSAAFVARAFLLSSAYGVDRFYWYAWDSKAMGLIEPTARTIKPGGAAIGILSKWLVGGQRPICSETNRIWLCNLSGRPSERRVVIWSRDSSELYVPPSGWKVSQIERADGRNESPPLPSASLRTSEMPRLLTLMPDTKP